MTSSTVMVVLINSEVEKAVTNSTVVKATITSRPDLVLILLMAVLVLISLHMNGKTHQSESS